MTLKEKLGQLIMFGFPGTELDEVSLKLIQEYKASNIILFSHNIISCEQLQELCATVQATVKNACGTPALICIDQEGGVVSRLPEGAVSFPSAMAVAATCQAENAFIAAHATACELAALGVNCNLAPVMDINTNAQNPVIGVRSYGSTLADVIPFALEAIRGHIQAGVMPVAKHFPGHGDTNVDSHLGLPSVNKSIEELMQCELVPFIQAINANAPAIMAAHILFPSIDDSGLPASMSPAILTCLLREKLGFKGLIVSDCFEMGAIQDNFGTAEGFVGAIIAGLDLGCISHKSTLALEALQLAENAVLSGRLSMQRVDAAVANVTKAKQCYAGASANLSVVGCEKYDTLATDMMYNAITRLDDNGELPNIDNTSFFVGCPAYRATFASSVTDDGNTFAQIMANKFNADFKVSAVKPTDKEIKEILFLTHENQVVVVGTYNAHLNNEQIDLVQALCSVNRQVIAVALRNPFDLPLMPSSVYKIAAYEYTKLSFNAVEKVLRGGFAAGKINLP